MPFVRNFIEFVTVPVESLYWRKIFTEKEVHSTLVHTTGLHERLLICVVRNVPVSRCQWISLINAHLYQLGCNRNGLVSYSDKPGSAHRHTCRKAARRTSLSSHAELHIMLLCMKIYLRCWKDQCSDKASWAADNGWQKAVCVTANCLPLSPANVVLVLSHYFKTFWGHLGRFSRVTTVFLPKMTEYPKYRPNFFKFRQKHTKLGLWTANLMFYAYTIFAVDCRR